MEDQLQSWGLRGIFPGPSESSEAFLLRADSLIPKLNADHYPSLSLLKQTFNTSPDWIEVVTDSKGLSFWEGAATWIEETADGKRSCRIQLKDSFLSRLYPKEEVIAHEMVHAMRLMFDEGRFEEILAYQTSKNRFRRYFGPLFTNPTESKLFLLALLTSWILYWAEIFFDFNLGGSFILLLPLLALGWGVFRLIRSQRIFSAALRHLAIAAPLAIALRLTDTELELFAKSTPEEIRAFAHSQKEQSLRWCQIYESFF
jgi:hypothetical protein